MPGQQGFGQGGGPGGGPRDNSNFMSSNARYQSQYQRMANHAHQQAAAAAMAGANAAGGGQIPSPGSLQRPQMMPNPMQNVSNSFLFRYVYDNLFFNTLYRRWGFMGARLALMLGHRKRHRN